jgi:hypothetical protein
LGTYTIQLNLFVLGKDGNETEWKKDKQETANLSDREYITIQQRRGANASISIYQKNQRQI